MEGYTFDNSVPRSGKWTVEEEAFANRLISEFESGSLGDCEDGCTLRSYLARKLNCAPMRISKKFAGQCIGKVCASRYFKQTTRDRFPHTFLPSFLLCTARILKERDVPRSLRARRAGPLPADPSAAGAGAGAGTGGGVGPWGPWGGAGAGVSRGG
ncbi:hypothetical protein B484DRAFT_328180 [Ochromonadaceae sp. CCMP2298]|nr:hypothetical protein B484DRAFT_328180 [Ochromonadaceae sp. CCMP2298]